MPLDRPTTRRALLASGFTLCPSLLLNAASRAQQPKTAADDVPPAEDLFGRDGFERNVEAVAEMEKQVGLYDLAGFTPEAP